MAEKQAIGLLREAAGPSHMEWSGNRRVVVEGCGGVLEYNTDVVRVKTGRLVARFTGRGLVIKCMTADALVIEGFIMGLEFVF